MRTKNFRITLAVCLSLFAATGINTNAQKAELVVQTGHSSSVNSVAFSPDRKTLASGSADASIKLWDVETGKELRSLKGHTSSVESVAFSPNGKTLASGSMDATIKLWDVESGRELKTLSGHFFSHVTSVAFSPDGKTLASCANNVDNSNATIKLWDIETGKELSTLASVSSHFNSVAFSPDGKTIASGSSSGDYRTTRLWDVESGNELKILTGAHVSVTSVSFTSDGKTLASGNNDGTITLWDVVTGAELRNLKGQSDSTNAVSFSLDGKTLASGSSDKTIKLWDVKSGIEICTLTGHSEPVWSVAFSSDGRTLASGSSDFRIKLWDVENRRELRTLKEHSSTVFSVSFSSDGKMIASGRKDGTIKLWDVENGKGLRTLTGHSSFVNSVTFSADGKTLTSISGDKTVKVWNAETGVELRTVTKHSDDVKSVAISSDGKTLASGSTDKTIRLWDVKNGIEMKTLSGSFSTVWAVTFSADGKTLASESGDHTIKLWDVESGTELKTLLGNVFSSNSVAFSADGKILAAASMYGIIKLWDVETGKVLKTLTGDSSSDIPVVFSGDGKVSSSISSLAFSPDGKLLASGSDDKTIKVWDVEIGGELKAFTGNSHSISEVAFSADGKTLLSVSYEPEIKLWDVSTGKEICSLIDLDENDWVVTTPEGRFDTNKYLDSIEGLHWVVSDDPMKPVPLDIFMRDYYEPKLLSRLLKCNQLNNCDREFKPLPNIAELNRVQPPVKITNVSLPDANRRVKVTVEVGKGAVPQKECRMKRCETGVYDLRLFRDSQMVGTYPGDGQAELIRQSESLKTSVAEKDLWRKVSGINPDKTAGCKTAGAAACGTQTFEVELPKGKNAADVEFTAYAFNEDRVKSQTDIYRWTNEQKAKLLKAEPVKPRAYIVAVGVNAYENSDFDLEFAADDARRMAEVVTQKLTATGQYEKVTPVTLISDYQTTRTRRIVTENQATKEKFHAVLDLLAGRNVDRQLLGGVKNADQLQRATPDDLVLIMYSSHGYADRAGNFYFIPYDTGPGTGKLFTESVRAHSISSDELSLWLRDVDAGEMIMIVDACHSSAAIEGSDFKPGPMGSRGLGQLSYDKGMKILTATQADNVALENNLIKQGLLTYALIRDGLEARQADFKPKDNVIGIGEWLSYGVDRVPKLYEEVQAGKIQDFGVRTGQQPKMVVARVHGERGKSGTKTLEEVVAEAKAQQPSLFDFTRRRRDVALIK